MQILKNLFGRTASKPADLEEIIGKKLLNLPICTANVVVASPEYSDTLYKSRIVISANDILRWLETHLESLIRESESRKTIARALRLWLRAANADTDPSADLPDFARDLLKPNVGYFVKEGLAQIHCPTCDSYWKEVSIEEFKEHPSFDRFLCTEIWKCPAGHELYKGEREITIFMG